MKQRKKKNPNNSLIMQGIIDAKAMALALDKDETYKLAKGLLEDFEEDRVYRDKTDELFDSHQYPDKRMTFVKTYNFNQCKAKHDLSGSASKVLSLFVDMLIQSNYVRVSNKAIGTYFKMGHSTVSKAIDELKAKGFIAVKVPQKGDLAAVYMINPAIASVGKPKGLAEQKEFEGLVEFDEEKPEEHPLLVFDKLQDKFKLKADVETFEELGIRCSVLETIEITEKTKKKSKKKEKERSARQADRSSKF